MKTLLYFGVAASLLLSVISCSDSQNFQGRMSPEERAALLQERLDLTDEQTKKVVQIMEESTEKMSELRDNFEGDRQQMREKMLQLREENNKKIEEILYEDQIPLFHDYLEEREQFRRNRRGQQRQQ